jgi:hypothetical protein
VVTLVAVVAVVDVFTVLDDEALEVVLVVELLVEVVLVDFGMQTGPTVGEPSQIAVRRVAVGVSFTEVVGATPTVISALPSPCWPSTAMKALDTVPSSNPTACHAW